VTQQTGSRQGNANTSFYKLAAQQATGAPIFHDVTTGSNSVPGATGFPAGLGFDFATGLGSVDAYQMVTRWNNLAAPLLVVPAGTAVTLAKGGSLPLPVTLKIAGPIAGPVKFSVTSGPASLAAHFTQTTFTAPGNWGATLTLSVASSSPSGKWAINLTASDGVTTYSTPLTVTIQ
jgi:hypothetical protein